MTEQTAGSVVGTGVGTGVSADLEDLMVAMDVVDTLRHSESLVARELDGAGRRERLLSRLRTMYAEQGIDVSDAVLMEGIDALEQERFQYQEITPSWRTRLAHIWVSRSRWSKPILFLLLLGGAFYSFYFAKEVWPQQRLLASLPTKIDQNIAAIIAKAKNPNVIEQASELAQQSRLEIDQGDLPAAKQSSEQLSDLLNQLNQAYQIRIVSGASGRSGVWREPPNNPNARNYYLIVEAIDSRNRVVAIDVLNEENNQMVRKKSWGLRVSEQAFYRIASDKRDDGIIQNNVVGEKKAGYLEPVFSVETTGATITDW